MVHHSRDVLAATDGHDIHIQLWQHDDQPKAVIHIVHGLGEYSDRYARFASAAVERGFAVVAHDQRGHGPKAEHPGYFSVKNGWHKLVEDVERVNDVIRERFDSTPVVLLGHSMGSYVAQNFAMYHTQRIDGLILSACTWPSKLKVLMGLVVAQVETWRLGAHKTSSLMHYLGFSSFNGRFKPVRTDHDWLSRDEVEVDKYIADPLCGGPFTPALWLDLAHGLLKIYSDHELLRIRSDLPILITGGEDDPVGGEDGMGNLALHYAQTGHQRIKVRIYEGGRHEMLNETNRDEVTSDWLDWIAATTRTSR